LSKLINTNLPRQTNVIPSNDLSQASLTLREMIAKCNNE